ncbi:MAG TPA: hypothetical protein VGC15_01765 [Acetobacteraceae bacterium]
MIASFRFWRPWVALSVLLVAGSGAATVYAQAGLHGFDVVRP